MPRKRGHIDDAAPAGAGHRAGEVLGKVEAAGQVRLDDAVPVVLGHAEKQAVLGDSRVIDEDIDHREFGEELLAGLGDLGAVGDVDRHGLGLATRRRDAGRHGAAGIGGLGHANDGHAIRS